MEHKHSLDPDDLDRPDWNSLLNNYDKHDIGEAYLQGRIEQIGLHVEHWGIDKRHEDDHLIYDNKMDLRLWEPLDGQESRPSWDNVEEDATEIEENFDIGLDTIERRWKLKAIADVKTKGSESWLGKFNLRHLAHYAEWADRFDVPVFIYMTMVDTDTQTVGERGFLTPIPPNWDWSRLLDHYDGDMNHSYGDMKDFARTCPIVKRTFRAPDGNLVVNIEDEYRFKWQWFTHNVL